MPSAKKLLEKPSTFDSAAITCCVHRSGDREMDESEQILANCPRAAVGRPGWSNDSRFVVLEASSGDKEFS